MLQQLDYHGSTIPVLLKLHLILAWRPTRTGKTAEMAAVAILFVALGFVSLMLGLAGFQLALRIPTEGGEFAILLMVASGLLAMVYVLIGFFHEGAGGGIDLSLLFHMPVSPRDMVLSGLAARFLSPWFAPPAAFFLGCCAGGLARGHVLTALAVVPGLLLWGAQVFLALIAGDFALYHLRRSRRFAEIMSMGFLAVFLVFVVVQFVLMRRLTEVEAGRGLFEWVTENWDKWSWLVGFLPGFSAFAWIQGGWQAPVALAAAVLEAAAWAGFASYLLARLMERGTAGAGKRKAAARQGRRRAAPGPLSALPVWPFFVKDLKYFARDPYLKTLLFGVLIGPMIFMMIFAAPSGRFGEGFLHFGMPYLLLMYLSQLSNNHLAMERAGLLNAIVSPLPRWRLLVGKNMALMALYLGMMCFPAGLLAWRGEKWSLILADWVMAFTLGLLYFGAGNFAAIFFPVPVAPAGKRLKAQVSTGRMFLMSLFHFVLLGTASALALPVFLGRVAVGAFSETAWVPATLAAVMVIYGLLLYAALVAGASRLMALREPDIYEVVVRGG
jgi:hypothetical protein